MRRLTLLPLIALAGTLPFVGSVSAQLPKPAGQKIAVLVGVNGYMNKPFENLKFAEADMIALKEKLEKSGFKVILLLGSATGEVPEGDEVFDKPFEASRENITAVLLEKRGKRFAFRNLTEAADQALVAFSGHGEQIVVEDDDGNGKKTEREVPFFCPKRAESGTPSTQVSLNDVLRTFNGTKAKALLLVDACRSFAENREGIKGAVIDRKRVDSLRPNVGGMFATGDRQAAREHENAGDGHGLFFQAVLTAMDSEKSQDDDGNVVWANMTTRISDLVGKQSRTLFPNLRDEDRQVPQPFGGFPDKFVLVAAVPLPPFLVKPITATFHPAEARPGETVTLRLTVELKDGYYTHPLVQTDRNAAEMVNTLTFPAASAVVFIGAATDPPTVKVRAEPIINIKEYKYLTGTVVYERKAVVSPNAKAGKVGVALKGMVLVNTSSACYPPLTIGPEAKLTVLDGPAVPVDAKYAVEVKKALDNRK